MASDSILAIIVERTLGYLLLSLFDFVSGLVILPIIARRRGASIPKHEIIPAVIKFTILMLSLEILLVEIGMRLE